MRRIILAAAFAVAITMLGVDLSRAGWGTGVCGPVGPLAVAQVGYQWRTVPGDDGRAYLFLNGKQLGGWDYVRETYRVYNHASDTWGEDQKTSPVPAPAVDPATLERWRGTAKDAPKAMAKWQTHGVATDEFCKHERYTLNGSEVGPKKCFEALAKGADDELNKSNVPDDSQKLWLVVRGDKAKREAFVAMLDAHPDGGQWAKKYWRVWAGDGASPDHYLMRDRDTGAERFPITDGAATPALFLMDKDGTELWHEEGCGPHTIANLLKADPAYRPNLSPGPRSETPALSAAGISPVVLIGGLGLVGIFLLSQKSGVSQ